MVWKLLSKSTEPKKHKLLSKCLKYNKVQEYCCYTILGGKQSALKELSLTSYLGENIK